MSERRSEIHVQYRLNNKETFFNLLLCKLVLFCMYSWIQGKIPKLLVLLFYTNMEDMNNFQFTVLL